MKKISIVVLSVLITVSLSGCQKWLFKKQPAAETEDKTNLSETDSQTEGNEEKSETTNLEKLKGLEQEANKAVKGIEEAQATEKGLETAVKIEE